MHVAKDDVNVKMDKPGAILRQKKDFGSVSGYDKISAEYFSLAAGVDTTPLCQGLEGDQCQSPHWGYVIKGQAIMTDKNGQKETVRTSDLFYWPAGHNVKIEEDADIIMFSPQDEHSQVIDHIVSKMS
jgi:hypothetical protein